MSHYVGNDLAMLQRQAVGHELLIRQRLLEALSTGGPRSRNVVVGIVGGEAWYARVVEPMLAAGEIVMRGGRGGRIGLP